MFFFKSYDVCTTTVQSEKMNDAFYTCLKDPVIIYSANYNTTKGNFKLIANSKFNLECDKREACPPCATKPPLPVQSATASLILFSKIFIFSLLITHEIYNSCFNVNLLLAVCLFLSFA